MREPYTQLFVHIVWSTWDRLPLLTKETRELVYRCIQKECASLGVQMIAVGGTNDHIHILVRLPSTVAVSLLVKQVKGSSSHAVNHILKPVEVFKWQGAYAALSVSKSIGPSVRSYIVNQEQHHRDKTTDRSLEIAWTERESQL